MHILLSSGLVTRFEVVASNDSSSSSSSSSPSQPQQQPPRGVKMRPNRVANKKKQKQKQQQQPSVMEIERAIGAGIFRERDVNSGGEGEKANLVDNILKNSVGKNEGSVEKRLRETGEWLLDQTETTTRSAGKQILTTLFVWIIPLWIAGFLVAAGIISLPFHTPFLDDLIS